MIQVDLLEKKLMHFKEPFQIAYEKTDIAPVIILKIGDEKGSFGLGSAAPDPEVTHETIDRVWWALKTKLKTNFFDLPMSKWYKYHEKIQATFEGLPSAQACIEEAILNLFTKQEGISLVNLFGGYRSSCPIVITIGIKDVPKTIQEIKVRTKEGYQFFKLKCGLDLNEEILKIKKINQILKSNQELVVDINQGYSFQEAEEFINKVRKTKVKLIEQPLAKENLQGLKRLNKISPIPVLADEAVVTQGQAAKLLIGDYVAGVNIKLMKCGGPINFLKIFHLAKALKKIVMIGCMYESNISIITGASVVLAVPVDYVDLDSGHLDFNDDPATGGAKVKQGNIFLGRGLSLKQA